MTITKLLGKRFLAQRVRSFQTMSSGGIHLPPIAMDDNNTGGPKEYLVVAVSDKITDFAPGDRVLCHSYTSGATEANPGEFVMDASMVVAVIPAIHD